MGDDCTRIDCVIEQFPRRLGDNILPHSADPPPPRRFACFQEALDSIRTKPPFPLSPGRNVEQQPSRMRSVRVVQHSLPSLRKDEESGCWLRTGSLGWSATADFCCVCIDALLTVDGTLQESVVEK